MTKDTKENTKLDEKLAEISAAIYESSPELREIIDKASRGELDESEALTLMMGAVTNNDTLNSSLQSYADEAMGELKATNPGLFQPPSGSKRLDPMFEARLYERIQFDEDAPELRVGPLPPGVKPAVPVEDAPPNPVALGAAMKTAADEMEGQIKALIEGDTAGTELTPWASHGFANLPQPASYQPGALPELMNVAVPAGGQLALFAVPESQELAWQAAVTTHGRRSAAQTIRRLVMDHLKDLGFDVEVREMQSNDTDILKKAVWTFSILGTGAESTQSTFSPVANASSALANELVGHFTLPNGMVDISTPLWLEMTTVDLIEERLVGWAALVRSR